MAFAGKDVDAVKAWGTLICGVAAGGIAGVVMVDSQGKSTGLDADICRETAAAIFGDAEEVKYVRRDRAFVEHGERRLEPRRGRW